MFKVILSFIFSLTIIAHMSAMEQDLGKRKAEQELVGSELKQARTDDQPLTLQSNDHQSLLLSPEISQIIRERIPGKDEIFLNVPYETVAIVAEFLEVIKYRLKDYIETPNEATKYELLLSAIDNPNNRKVNPYLQKLALKIRNCPGLYIALNELKLTEVAQMLRALVQGQPDFWDRLVFDSRMEQSKVYHKISRFVQENELINELKKTILAELSTLQVHSEDVSNLDMLRSETETNRKLGYSCQKGYRAWLASKKLLVLKNNKIVQLPSSFANKYAWSPIQDDRIAIATSIGSNSANQYCEIYNLKNQQRFQIPSDFEISKLSWSPNGRYLMCAGKEGWFIYDYEAKEIIQSGKNEDLDFDRVKKIIWSNTSANVGIVYADYENGDLWYSFLINIGGNIVKFDNDAILCFSQDDEYFFMNTRSERPDVYNVHVSRAVFNLQIRKTSDNSIVYCSTFDSPFHDFRIKGSTLYLIEEEFIVGTEIGENVSYHIEHLNLENLTEAVRYFSEVIPLEQSPLLQTIQRVRHAKVPYKVPYQLNSYWKKIFDQICPAVRNLLVPDVIFPQAK